MTFTHVGFDPRGAIVLDIGADQEVPVNEAEQFCRVVLSRVSLARLAKHPTVTIAVGARAPLSIETARALVSDLEDRIAEAESRLPLAERNPS